MPRRQTEMIEELGNVKKLSSTELDFMNLIWKHPQGISSDEIYASFPQATGTKSTILYRVSQKGYVNVVQKGLHHIYTPKFTKLEYEQALIRRKLEKAFDNGSIIALIADYCGIENLSRKQTSEIQSFLYQLEAQQK